MVGVKVKVRVRVEVRFRFKVRIGVKGMVRGESRAGEDLGDGT